MGGYLHGLIKTILEIACLILQKILNWDSHHFEMCDILTSQLFVFSKSVIAFKIPGLLWNVC